MNEAFFEELERFCENYRFDYEGDKDKNAEDLMTIARAMLDQRAVVIGFTQAGNPVIDVYIGRQPGIDYRNA